MQKNDKPVAQKTSRPAYRRAGSVLDATGVWRSRPGAVELLLSIPRPHRSAAAPGAADYHLVEKAPALGRFIHQLLCGEGWTVNRKRV